MFDGTYCAVYVGPTGPGAAFFAIHEERVRGYDIGGVRYVGTVGVDDASGEVVFALQMEIPAGSWLVSGASAQSTPTRRSVELRLPRNFADGVTVELPVPPAGVKAIVQRVPDEFKAAAVRGFRLAFDMK